MIRIALTAYILLTGASYAQNCQVMQVPVYKTHNEMGGMLLGGLLGSQFCNGSGNYIAAAVGALLGRDIAMNTTTAQIIGYRNARVCEQVPMTPRYNQYNSLNSNLMTCNVGGRLIRC